MVAFSLVRDSEGRTRSSLDSRERERERERERDMARISRERKIRLALPRREDSAEANVKSRRGMADDGSEVTR